MATTNVSLTYRPIRVAWLVAQGDTAALVEAATLSSVLWGGVFHPIIPIQTGDDAAQLGSVMAEAGIDALIPLSNEPEVRRVYEYNRFMRTTAYFSAERASLMDRISGRQRLILLDVAPLYRFMKSHEDEEARLRPPLIACRPIWAAEDPLNVAFGLQFGRFPAPETYFTDYAALFSEVLNAQEFHIAPDSPIASELVASVSPIRATGYRRIGVSTFANETGFYFGDHRSFDDLLTFWNLRASGARLLFISLGALSRYAGVIEGVAREAQMLREVNPRYSNVVPIFGNYTPDAVDAVRQSAPALSPRHFGSVAGRLAGLGQVNIRLYRHQTVGHYDQADTTPGFLTVVLPTPNFAEERFHADELQQAAIDITWLGAIFKGTTLRPPHRPDLNEAYSREIAFDPWSVRSIADGISVITRIRSSALRLKPITFFKVIEVLFAKAEIKVARSQAGLLADKVLEKFGDLTDSHVFKVRGVRRLLKELAADDSVTYGEATRRIHNDGQFAAHQDLYLAGQQMTTASVFTHLLEKDVLRAGLSLVCDQCHLDSWHSLPRLADFWECEFCGKSNRTSVHLKDRGDWRVRKSGLFARDNNQEGALPVLLGLGTLGGNMASPMDECIYTTSVQLTGPGLDAEADFVMLTADHAGCCVIMGEAKSEGGEFTEDDATKLLAAARRLENIGVQCMVAYVKTADSFRAEEIERLRGLHAQGIQVIMLCNSELEPQQPYGPNATDVPQMYAVSALDFANNTLVRYLQSTMPP
jgi:hypothetical protein